MLIWQQGDAVAQAEINGELLSGNWLLCISFYNDYIFSREELQKIGCVVNIHPALPHLRGRGYDVIPLLEGHSEHGATLHFVTEKIDAGQIIDVLSRPIPAGVGYQEFRSSNQRLSLEMLTRLLGLCQRVGLQQVPAELARDASISPHVWRGSFTNSARLGAMLSELRWRNPEHPLLLQLPATLLAGGLDAAQVETGFPA